jgi:hypothetical protein
MITKAAAHHRPGGSKSKRAGRGSAFAAVVDQLVRGCAQQGTELANWPFDYIARIADAAEPPAPRAGDATERAVVVSLLRSAEAYARGHDYGVRGIARV